MLKHSRVISLLFVLFRFVVGDKITDAFVRDYFRQRNIRHINVFACGNETDGFEFAKNVMNGENVVSYNAISSEVHLRRVLKVNYYHVGVVLNFDCPTSGILLEKFARELVFNESYVWLLLTKSSIAPIERLKNLPFSIETELTVANRIGNSFEMHDMYNPSYTHGGNINVTRNGRWTAESGFANQLNQYKYKRRGNFNLLPLNFSIVLRFSPEPDLKTYLETPIKRHLDTMDRYHYALILQMRELFNFSINLKLHDSWGYRQPNGSFSGLLGSLIKGESDMSASPFQFKDERLNVIDYTLVTLDISLRFFFRHPRTNNLQNNFLKPFESSLWWLTLTASLVFWIFLLFLRKIEIYWKETEEDSDTGCVTAVTTLAAITQQGLNDGPIICSGRIVFLSLFLWALLVFQFYSASIVGSLLAPPQRWIKTIKNLSESSLECAVEDMPYMYDYFAYTANPRSILIYETKIKPTKKRPKGGYVTAVEGLERVRKGGFAFHITKATGYKVIEDTFNEDEICDLQQIDMAGSIIVSMVTRKHSPFNEMIRWGLLKSIESGLTQHLYKTWHHQSPQCPDGYSSKPTPVSMQQFLPAIFLILIGCSLSIAILFMECIHHRCRQQNQLADSEKGESIGNSDTESNKSDVFGAQL